jgi:head-tail adaptor
MAVPIAQELNQFIEFKNVGAPFDASSKIGVVISTFASAWARITDLGGSMDAEDMQHPTQIQGFEIWCRYIEGLTGFMQISWGTRSLTITGPPQKTADMHGRMWWIIRAEEVKEQSL